jgi:hypothetical protein
MVIAHSPVEELTDEQAREVFEERVQRCLHLSTDGFLVRYDSGAYDGVDEPAITQMVMLLPLVR